MELSLSQLQQLFRRADAEKARDTIQMLINFIRKDTTFSIYAAQCWLVKETDIKDNTIAWNSGFTNEKVVELGYFSCLDFALNRVPYIYNCRVSKSNSIARVEYTGLYKDTHTGEIYVISVHNWISSCVDPYMIIGLNDTASNRMDHMELISSRENYNNEKLNVCD